MSIRENQNTQEQHDSPSLLKRFVILQAVLLMLIASWFIYRFNDIQSDLMQKRLSDMAWDIEHEFIGAIAHAESMLEYIGKDWAYNRHSLQEVYSMISELDEQSKVRDLVDWKSLVWSDKKGLQGKDGKLVPYNDIKIDSALLKKCKAHPYKLYVGKAVMSRDSFVSSKLPFCFGIADRKGKYIGAFLGDFLYGGFNDKIFGYWDSGKDYLIFNNNGNILMRSEWGCRNGSKLVKDYLSKQFSRVSFSIYPFAFMAPNNMSSMIRPLKNLPYNIAVIIHHEEMDFHSILGQLFKSPLIDCILLAFILGITLLFVRRYIIKPVVELSGVADAISSDSKNVNINDYSSYELRCLADALRKVLIQRFDLLSANKKLEFLFQKASTASKVKFDFIRNMQHELRTPLNHILSSTEIISSEFSAPLAKEHQEYVQIIKKSAKELLDMFNNMISVADFHASRIEINEEVCSIKKLVQSSIKFVEHKIKLNELKLHIEIQDEIPDIYVDKSNLQKALIAILDNSILFNVEKGSIFIRVFTTKTDVVFEVEDTGIGIAKQDLGHITEMFEYVGDVMRKPYKGLGLGLSIAQSVVKLHGGSLNIQSKQDIGTKVQIALSNDRLRMKS